MSESDSKWYGRLCVNCGHDYAHHSEHLSGRCFGTQDDTGHYKHVCEFDCPKFNHKGFEYLVKRAMKVGGEMNRMQVEHMKAVVISCLIGTIFGLIVSGLMVLYMPYEMPRVVMSPPKPPPMVARNASQAIMECESVYHANCMVFKHVFDNKFYAVPIWR